MASSKEYMSFVLEQLSGVEGLSYRAMMGEFVIYVRGKVVGGVYDDRLLIKDTVSARKLTPNAQYELPYDGGRPMLSVDVDDRELACRLFNAVADDLPAPAQKNRKN